MRDAAIAIIREIGVETGGSNIQFARRIPTTGRMVVIEMNPRVSRSSALASKATGFPIAKIAAKLAVGYTLDEIPNDITRETPACFEPTIDYVVMKIPRFAFEKFPQADDELGHADEVGRRGDGDRPHVQGGAAEGDPLARDRPRAASSRGDGAPTTELAREAASAPTRDRLLAGRRGVPARPARRRGRASCTRDRPVVPPPRRRDHRARGARCSQARRSTRSRRRACARSSSAGFSDRRLAQLARRDRGRGARAARARTGVRPVYKRVDTCAAEFEAHTPYLYSTYEDGDDEARRTDRAEGHDPRRRPEPDRAGHRVRLLLRARRVRAARGRASRRSWSTATRRRCRPTTTPPTGSTSSRSRSRTCSRSIEREKPEGVIVQFGGQTPLKLAVPLERAGVPDPRHVARRDRPRRGPRALRARC